MQTVKTTIDKKLEQVSTIVAVKTIKGTSFVGVRNYENSKGEISNQTFLVGVDYGKLLESDLKTLKTFNLKPILKKYDKEIVAKAYKELLSSLVKRTASEFEKAVLRASGDSTMKRSDGQSDAFESISNGLKTKDGSLFIYGLSVRKEILVSGDYPTTNKQLKTIVKNEIKRQAKLKEINYKQFKLGNLETLKIQGVTI